jgi:acyl-CoA synthetase (AMP-forming)/AMP-acid ligase II
MGTPNIPEACRTAFDAFEATARAYPQKIFLCVPDGTPESRKNGVSVTEYDYGTVYERVQNLRAIFEKSKIGHGHRVALLLGNRAEYIFCFFALNSLGAWVVPINPENTTDEMLYQLAHSDVDVAITTNARRDAFTEVIETHDPEIEVYAVESLPEFLKVRPRALHAGKPDRETIASVLYTSGTTGKPKGCLISNQYGVNAGAWYLSRGGHQTLEFGEDRLFNPFPVHHMNAGIVSLMAMVFSANCLVLWDRFHPKTWWRDVVATGSTAVHYMGLIPPVLVKQDPVPEERQHKVKFAFGAGVDPDIHVEFEKRFGIPLIEVFGMTETGRTISNSIEPRNITTRAFGKARDGLEIMIADDNDNLLPAGTPGNFLIRFSGSNPRLGFFSGYLNDEATTEEAWRGGWFHTGDVCKQGADGMLYFVDRKKNIIRRSGENIAAAEVEAAIAAHSSVHTVACLPIPDEMSFVSPCRRPPLQKFKNH